MLCSSCICVQVCPLLCLYSVRRPPVASPTGTLVPDTTHSRAAGAKKIATAKRATQKAAVRKAMHKTAARPKPAPAPAPAPAPTPSAGPAPAPMPFPPPGTTGDPTGGSKIGRAHVGTPVTNAQLVCRLLLEQKNKQTHDTHIT